MQCAAPAMQHCCAQAPQHRAHTHSSPNPKPPSPPATTPCHPSHTSHHKQHAVDARTRGHRTQLASDRKKKSLACINMCARAAKQQQQPAHSCCKGTLLQGPVPCYTASKATLRCPASSEQQQAQRAPGSWCANAHARACATTGLLLLMLLLCLQVQESPAGNRLH